MGSGSTLARGRALLAAAALAAATPTAIGASIHGRAEIQELYASERARSLEAALGERSQLDTLGELRLIWEPHADHWDFSLHYLLDADAGDTPGLARREAALGLAPQVPPGTWWNLGNTFLDRARFRATQRIDRLAIGYTGSNLVLRAGRQALTWGAGLVFHPLDLLDPFAPTATDTEYKPGTDLLYGQYLFGDGSDLQAVLVPRPARSGGWPAGGDNSCALRFHRAIGPLQSTWIAARDYGDWVTAFGISGSLRGAAWNVEIIPTVLRTGSDLTSMLANVSRSIHALGRDATLYGEYYHNGFGVGTSERSLGDLPVSLRVRLARGQLFVTGRDYLAAGAILQWTPLLQISPTLIAGLQDGSLLTLVQASYSLRENLDLIVGGQLPIGPGGTQFGGVPVFADGTAPYVGPSALGYLQLRRYF